MDTVNLNLFISIVIPMSMTLLICKGRSRKSMLFVIIGMTVCLFTGEINALLFNNCFHSMKYYVVNMSPFIEELFKSVPLFLYAYILKPKRQEVLQNAVSLGVGFAIFENAVVIAQAGGRMDFMSVLIRSFGSGLMHAIATLWVGCGIILIYLNRKLFLTGSIAVLFTASIFHSVYNALIGSSYEIIGLLLPIVTLVPLLEILIKRGLNNRKEITEDRVHEKNH